MYAVSYGLHVFASINHVYIFGLSEQCTGHKVNLKNVVLSQDLFLFLSTRKFRNRHVFNPLKI